MDAMVHNGWEAAVFARELQRERMREAAMDRALAEAGIHGIGVPMLSRGFGVSRLLEMLRARRGASAPEPGPSPAPSEAPHASARPVIRLEQYASRAHAAQGTAGRYRGLVIIAGGKAASPAQR
jgi:hypothetical protein